MSQATSRATVAGACPSPAAPGFGAFAAASWLADHWRRIQVIRQLSSLSDHHLQDIGIVRGDIEQIAAEMVKRRRTSRA